MKRTSLTSILALDDVEPPETPAPLFAIRAVKSALLGSPAPPLDDTILQEREDREAMAAALASESPTKRQGILMTPGTARARKTVTFGSQVNDSKAKPNSMSGIPDDCPGKFPSPWVPKEPSPLGDGSAKKTALTRSLERVRETRKKQEETQIKKNVESTIPTPKPLRAIEVEAGLTEPQLDEAVKRAVESSKAREMARQAEENALLKARAEIMDIDEKDITIDFNEPRSQSGRFWKTEYDVYHRDATEQMKKLIRYKKLAKNYAKKKDEEASNLSAKLEEEQQRVYEMEDRIAELVTHIARSRFGSNDDSADLINTLTKQTALALQYRSQVDKFREALQGKEQALKIGHVVSSRPDQAQDKNAQATLHEMEELRQKMDGLQSSLNTAERKVSRLQNENATLFRELAKTKEELTQSEKRRQAAESEASASKQRFEELEDTYNTIKERAKKQRLDAERHLDKRHDQVLALRKQIAALKNQASGGGNGHALDDEIVAETRNKRRSRTTLSKEEENKLPTKPAPSSKPSLRDIRMVTETRPSDRTIYDDNERRLPQLEGSTVKPRRASERFNEETIDNKRPRPRSTTTLRGVSGKRNAEIEEPILREDIDSNLRHRFTALSNATKMTAKPNIQSRRFSTQALPSQRPSMYNLPKENQEFSGVLSRHNRHDEFAAIEDRPGRLDSMVSTRSRSNLDPERAAAAKMRLEKRNSEKRRLRESMGWENKVKT